MYETIYVEKNKTSRFGVHFYKDSSDWKIFLDICGVDEKKIAIICSNNIQNDTWKALMVGMPSDDVYKISEDSVNDLRQFLDAKKGYTMVVFSEPAVMEALSVTLTSEDAKLSFVCVPVTPFAQFAGVSILPQCDENGEVTRKEILPKGVYVDVSILKNASPVAFQGAIASAFRLAISYKASFFEWMISNMYELLDGEEEAICEFLERGYNVQKERIEKDTAKERSISLYANDFYNVLSGVTSETSEADLWALSMVCQSYLSWKREFLSMEEYYEIRDMFVFFGLGISETFATDTELLEATENMKNELFNRDTAVYIRKIGKLLVEEAPSKELVREAFSQIYYNELDNE